MSEIPRGMIGEEYLEFRAELELDQEIRRKEAGSDGTPVVCYEETDQTPLRGDEAKVLGWKIDELMDYTPFRTSNPFTAWTKAIFAGDYEGFLKILDGKTAEEINQLLKMRESLMNYCAVHHVVQGALALHSQDPRLGKVVQLSHSNLNVRNEHVKILLKLLSLGVDVNARDVAGFTPLHICVEKFANDVTNQMAEILLKAGAEVDARNRLGQTPLYRSVLFKNLKNMALLLKHGASPSSKNNDGDSLQFFAIFNPEMYAMIAEAEREERRLKEKEKGGGGLRRCSVCDKTSGTMQCSGCFSVWYCGRDCQKSAWSSHKEECKEKRSQYSECILTPESGKTAGLKETNFVVKIERTAIPGEPLLIFNKDRSFSSALKKEDNELVYSQLEKLIADRGVEGLKGYFHALVPKKPDAKDMKIKLEINTVKILPGEAW